MDTKKFTQKLLEIKNDLESELKNVGRRNPKDKTDWVATGSDEPMEMIPDPNEEADKIEELEQRVGIEKVLEERLVNVTKALERIEEGTYGICTSGDGEHKIEEERLEANPAAATCIKHM